MTGSGQPGYPMSALPSQYNDQCTPYLQNPDQAPPADMSDVLNDGSTGPYPFQGFTYCLLNLLKQEHGDEAMTATKQEITGDEVENWRHVIFTRDNQFRKLNGSPALKKKGELDDQAQRWAEKMAKECNLYHSNDTIPDRQWRGSSTGESISSSGSNPDGSEPLKNFAAYLASDGWYEEVKNYPFPDGYTGDNSDALFYSIGHFTQTVWKSTKYVGYGYAYNANCPGSGNNWFIAGRYSPPGNWEGQYQANVLPAQS